MSKENQEWESVAKFLYGAICAAEGMDLNPKGLKDGSVKEAVREFVESNSCIKQPTEPIEQA